VSLKNLDGGCLPTQIEITTVPPGSSPFCIDATEVTNARYQQFLDSHYTMSEAAIPGGVCDGEDGGVPTTVTPTAWPPASGSDDFPVTNVNWCQAYTFCKWAGERLCGQIGGGPLLAKRFSDPTQSQWLNACSKGGTLTYPYGNTWAEEPCGGQAANSNLESVTYSTDGASCVGPLPGLYDMSGNVWEWTDTCNDPIPGQTNATAFCDTMGGAFDSVEAELECVGERNWVRGNGAANIGIRCCLDL
jgi:formylglycine-generating enzyme required for sulfatase activity